MTSFAIRLEQLAFDARQCEICCGDDESINEGLCPSCNLWLQEAHLLDCCPPAVPALSVVY